MTPSSRELFAHLARALSRYIPEAEREARQLGYGVPPELLSLAEFFTDCARTRPNATSGAAPAPGADGVAMTDSLMLLKREAAVTLRVSVRQVERLIAAGKLSAVKVGGSTRIRRSDLDAYVAALGGSASFRDNVTAKDSA